MRREVGAIQASTDDQFLDDAGYSVTRQWITEHTAQFDRAEQDAVGDAAESSHVVSAPTGLMWWLWGSDTTAPCPSYPLAAPDGDQQPFLGVLHVISGERDKFAAAECTGHADRDQRAVPLADQVVATLRQHSPHDIGGGRVLLDRRSADGAAYALHHCAHAGRRSGRWIDPGLLVRIRNRGEATADARRLQPAAREVRHIGGNDPLVRWQGCGAPGQAIGAEVRPQSAA